MPIHVSGGDLSALNTETNVVTQPPTVKWLILAIADTEQSYTLPTGTKRFKVMAWTGGTVRLAYASGKSLVQVPESNNEFEPVPAGASYWEEELNTSAPPTLYISSATVTTKVVVKSWQE